MLGSGGSAHPLRVASQSMPAKNGCALTSAAPNAVPSRAETSKLRSSEIKLLAWSLKEGDALLEELVLPAGLGDNVKDRPHVKRLLERQHNMAQHPE